MMDIKAIEIISNTLDVKSRIVTADIKELARFWEEPLRDARFADPRLAFYILKAVARAYLRGRNLRMGNAQGLRRHELTKAMLMRTMIRYAAGESMFSCLYETGVISLKAFASALNSYADIADEASKVLQERQNDERG
ncbi:hypothetical protein B1778_00695 [Dehalococcoides mccartyi]|uniref:hypothetical protein n=1 Tax=Dehalococcoides mccartyi TaxID=61435 RepID=UPI00098FA72A|nr:hypothetical protein [Dehalococcoides mccartyi]AQU05293.1 hypothetical protein B1777_00840 [Dehalococcoides mccartyi]AQU06746.1 hypothetical protein B1778_00695 [Dehalococcoides mccartyi]